MEKNTITFNGRETDTFIEKSSVRLIYLLGREKKKGYSDNPPVAAVVNGELKSLQSEIPENAVVDLVYLDSKAGRTVYRRTLCFLLSYASRRVYPGRTLLVGHSLGDGYYFTYEDKGDVDVEALRSVMKDAIDDDMTVDIQTLSATQSLSYVSELGMKDTEKLLRTRNDGSYTFNRIGNTLGVNYEPLLPSLRLLQVWDIMKYGSGMLLRYPQSRSPEKILPFTDNPLLFKVYEEAREDSKILDASSLGALNQRVSDGSVGETIVLSETLFRTRLHRAAEAIREKGGVRIAFISGPACSGKKSCGLKLSAELRTLGFSPIIISIDDYRTEKGDSIDALDTEMLRRHVRDLLDGKEVELNCSDLDRSRLFRRPMAKMGDKSILVIEGVQTLNGTLIPELKEEEIFRIFVSALPQLTLDTISGISSRDNRLIRSIVKECRTSSRKPQDVIRWWTELEEEEKNHLFPYQNNADMMINSALEYEVGVLYSYVMPLLRSVGPDEGEAYTTARRLMTFMKLVYPIPSELVPSDSVLREFIGGSAYNLG